MKTKKLTINEYTCVLIKDIMKEQDLKKFRIKKNVINYLIKSVTFRISHILYKNTEITQKKKIIILIYLTTMFENKNILKVFKYETR